MAVNIADMFGDLQPKAQKPKLQEIELHLIDENPKNFYSMDGIDELADNIRMFGLMEPLIVKENGGRYMLISGHRRRAALKKLAEEGFFPEMMHHKVDCIVAEEPATLPGIEDPAKQKMALKTLEDLRLIYANSDTRRMTSADTARQVQEIRTLLSNLKELGYKLPGRMRDLVAEAAKVSAARVGRLDVIEKNLKDRWMRQAWKDGDLQETSAYEIARRPPEIQELLAERVDLDSLCDMKTEDVIVCLNGCEADGNRKRPETKTVVPARDPSKSAEEITAEYRAASDMEDGILRDICRRNLGEILRDIMWNNDHDFSTCFRIPNIDAMKKHPKSWCPSWHGSGESLEWDSRGVRVQKLMEKDDKRSWVSFNRSWTDFYDALSGAAMQQAREKKEEDEDEEDVSTVDTSVALEWQKGDPPKRGRYLCTVDMGGGEYHEYRMEWFDRWYAFGNKLEPAFKVVGWFPLPKELEE